MKVTETELQVLLLQHINFWRGFMAYLWQLRADRGVPCSVTSRLAITGSAELNALTCSLALCRVSIRLVPVRPKFQSLPTMHFGISGFIMECRNINLNSVTL